MAKPIKKHKKNVIPKKETKQSFFLSYKNQNWIFLGFTAILLLFLLKPLVIDGLSPQGADVVSSIGLKHQINEYSRNTGQRALWNPNIFAGMPTYQRHNAIAFSADNLFSYLGRFINNVYLYYLFAFIGVYLLFRFLKMTPLISFIAAVIFILMPHFKSLYIEGHYTKFRALMILPWVFLSFKYFLDKRNVLSVALFALAFGWQIRTQHYQIVFYTALMIFALGIYPFIKDLLDKKFKLFVKSIMLLLAAITISITMSAQPLFLAKEYLPYSKRGKTTINLKTKTPARDKISKSDGVKMEYATQWSTHPSEVLTWFVPRFYGGMSGEKYMGNAAPQLRNRVIPGYWGHMPFTQSYEYMGIITLFLAFIGLYAYRKDKMILSIALFAFFLILLSFGRHFQIFYSILYNYFPYFNKFRAPMMSVTVTSFMISILAAYGLKYICGLKQGEVFVKYKPVLITMAALFVFGILLLLIGQTFSFTKAGEKYDPQVMNMIKNARKEFFNQDMIRYLILVLLTSGSVIAFLKRKISFNLLGGILAVLIIFDLTGVQARMHKDCINVKKLEKQYFRQTPTDRFLQADKEIFRIFPAGREIFKDNRWAYYHQTIGGYTPIKMYTIEEFIENNLYHGWERNMPVNWNVLKILNVKYIIIQGKIKNEHLTPVNSDKANSLYTYLFKERLPRGFFVGGYDVIKDEYKRLHAINNPKFDPQKTAILEEDLSAQISQPDSSWSKVVKFTPNQVSFETYTDKQALFVISELYYPPGWKIFIDDQAVDHIYKTDHAIQSVIVPEGKHNIDMRFEPDSYFRNIKIAYISVGILYLTIIISLFTANRNRILSKAEISD
jgi:hypothetical protein